MDKFYRFARMEDGEARLLIDGPLEPDNPWMDDQGVCAPRAFRDALADCDGRPLTVVIDSPGGDVAVGVAMYDALRKRRGETRAEVLRAYSAATLPLCACNKGKRAISPLGTVMIHNPSCGTYGDHNEMRRAQEYLQALGKAAAAAYAEAMGKDESEVAALMERETYWSAQDAVDNGLVDSIYDTGTGASAMRGYLQASMAATEKSLRAVVKARYDQERAEILRQLEMSPAPRP